MPNKRVQDLERDLEQAEAALAGLEDRLLAQITKVANIKARLLRVKLYDAQHPSCDLFELYVCPNCYDYQTSGSHRHAPRCDHGLGMFGGTDECDMQLVIAERKSHDH